MLSNNTSYSNTNVSVVEGSFRVRVPEGTVNAITRVNKLQQQVTEVSFSRLEGFITRFDIEDTKFGKQTKITIKSDKSYNLSLGYADSLTVNIYKMLRNIDITKPVQIDLSRKPTEEGKMRTSIFINQDNEPVKWAYTKNDPKGLPPMEKIMVKGKEEWDNSKQLEFLYVNDVKPFQAKISNNHTVVNYAEGHETVDIPTIQMPSYDQEISPDDMPF